MPPRKNLPTEDPMEQFLNHLGGLSQVATPLDDADDENPQEEEEEKAGNPA